MKYNEIYNANPNSRYCDLHFTQLAVCFFQFGRYRSSHRRCSVKKGVLQNFAQNSRENTCARVFFLIKLQSSGLQTFLKKRLWRRCFPVNFAKSLKTTFLQTHMDDCFCFFLNRLREEKKKGSNTGIFS